MADGSLRTPGVGETVASDDVAGVKYQRVKMNIGADGTAVDVLVPADAVSLGAVVPVALELSNGSTGDIMRGNTEATALASAARTATTTSATLTNYNARGVIIELDVVTPGTSNLTVQVITAESFVLANFTAVTADSIYVLYPGAATGAALGSAQVASAPLPRVFAIKVVHGDASSWTYSVFYKLIV